ncbi:Nn.00g026750.m01.CDS01 [Neocucurbitaria sp. VM-36]
MPTTQIPQPPVLRSPVDKDTSYVRVHNALHTIQNLRGGEDISKYSLSARKELASAYDVIDIYLGDVEDIEDADKIEEVPKLALLVTSTTFRQKIVEKPEIAEIKVTSSLDLQAVAVLMNWVKDVVHSKAHHTIKVPVPTDIVAKVKLVHAAHVLGMDRYVNHVVMAFKHEIRSQVPRPDQCSDFEKYGNHEMIKAVGERFGYLLRTRQFPGNRKIVTNFLARNDKLGKAVRDADARALARRATRNQS